MYPELTNLVPPTVRKGFRTEYFIRLATVTLLFLVGLMIVQGVFLLPSYLYERILISTRTQELQKLTTLVGGGIEQQAQAQIDALSAESAYLLSMKKAGTASKAIQAVLAVPHPQIQISGIIFQQATPTVPTRTLQLTGVAGTRDALRSYDTALSALPHVSNADLPISSYAKEIDIPFTITLTGSLQP